MTKPNRLGRISLHEPWLPRRGFQLAKRFRQAGGGVAGGGLTERVAELGDLARVHLNGRLREPADPFAEGLLPQFEPAPFGGLDENDEQPFFVRERRNIA